MTQTSRPQFPPAQPPHMPPIGLPPSRPQTWTSGLWSLLETSARELARLLVPLACAGCAEPDYVLCPACAEHFLPQPMRAEQLAPRLGGSEVKLWAQAKYREPLNYVVAAWKEGKREDLSKPLAQIMAGGGRHLGAQLLAMLPPITLPLAEVRPADRLPTILVVPLPSTERSRRERGFMPAEELAYGVVAGLREAVGPHARVCFGPGLTVTSKKADQVGLNARRRAQNLHGSISVGSLLRVQSSAANVIVLVDDLVTTGATMREVLRVLPRQPGTLVAGFTLCVTLKRLKSDPNSN